MQQAVLAGGGGLWGGWDGTNTADRVQASTRVAGANGSISVSSQRQDVKRRQDSRTVRIGRVEKDRWLGDTVGGHSQTQTPLLPSRTVRPVSSRHLDPHARAMDRS